MVTMRAQWPHTVDDIVKSLDGIWGLVGATGVNGNLFRLERSLHEPLVYTLTEYEGSDESKVVSKRTYSADQKREAVAEFAQSIGL
ncbi:MAG TPA: hypothetical protein V6D08_07690 [Candidatus Obscuribacterales bacterium]